MEKKSEKIDLFTLNWLASQSEVLKKIGEK